MEVQRLDRRRRGHGESQGSEGVLDRVLQPAQEVPRAESRHEAWRAGGREGRRHDVPSCSLMVL